MTASWQAANESLSTSAGSVTRLSCARWIVFPTLCSDIPADGGAIGTHDVMSSLLIDIGLLSRYRTGSLSLSTSRISELISSDPTGDISQASCSSAEETLLFQAQCIFIPNYIFIIKNYCCYKLRMHLPSNYWRASGNQNTFYVWILTDWCANASGPRSFFLLRPL